MYLFFDVETAGFIDYKINLMAASQPRITQIAAILTDENGTNCDSMDFFIKPNGWVIPKELEDLNGITNAMCHENGIAIKDALFRFNEMKAQAKLRIAHNITFDKQMICREEYLAGMDHKANEIESFCTMQNSKSLCKLPPSEKQAARGIKAFKPPTLQEAYFHFFKKEFDNAHNAMADVLACKEIFFAIKDAA